MGWTFVPANVSSWIWRDRSSSPRSYSDDVTTGGRVHGVASQDDIARLHGEGGREDNGVVAAGLPPAWVDWLGDETTEPGVRVALDDGDRSVGSLIARLFPEAAASERREARRRTTGSPDKAGEV